MLNYYMYPLTQSHLAGKFGDQAEHDDCLLKHVSSFLVSSAYIGTRERRLIARLAYHFSLPVSTVYASSYHGEKCRGGGGGGGIMSTLVVY